MISTLEHRALLVTAMFMVATPTYSQALNDIQRNAIRSACRADCQAHCASVPAGGQSALQCLQKNMSSLSSGCQGAVRAVETPAVPRAATGSRRRAGPVRGAVATGCDCAAAACARSRGPPATPIFSVAPPAGGR
jgi:hypothetical protein